jgi:cystathionine beta-lyase/cystathionine gamma-synthase
MRERTKILRAGQEPDPETGAVTVPIYQTATYKKKELGQEQEYEYSREGNPTSRKLEESMTALENGIGAVTFSSGMATIVALLTSLEEGQHILASEQLYGGTIRLFDEVLDDLGLDFTYVDTTDLSDFTDHLQDNTRMVFIETPTNPTLRMTDIQGVCERVDDDITVVMDNTFMSPYFQKPLDLGADIVVHSLTKYLSGHNDLIGGVAVVNDEEWLEQLEFMLKTIGPPLAPTEAYLTLRGIKTLAVRMEQHEENAMELARFLEDHEAVKQVNYPGLESHPEHDIAKKQMTGFGGMLSCQLNAGLDQAVNLVSSTEHWIFADSLGGCDSLISHPATQSHEDVDKEIREEQGITDGLVRLSPGLEDVEDLKDDLARHLDEM